MTQPPRPAPPEPTRDPGDAEGSVGGGPSGSVSHTPDSTSEPHLPNDRDESTGMTDGAPSEQVQQAHEDVKRGLEDTSRGRESNDAYEKLKK